MKGTLVGWDLKDVTEALEASLFICTSSAVNEERPERQRDLLDKATRHLYYARARVLDALGEGPR